MNEKYYQEALGRLGKALTEDQLSDLKTVLLLEHDPMKIDVGDMKLRAFDGSLPTDGMTFDYLGMRYAVRKESRDRIMNTLKDILGVMEEQKPKAKKEPKKYS